MTAASSASLATVGILAGVTASGKTALALEFARRHPHVEIVNADSLLIYRGMDIGTAKPTASERGSTRHHLIDIRDPAEDFTAAHFRAEVHKALDDIHSRGQRALLVGGTGFYLKALLYGLWDAPPADDQLRAELSKFSGQELYDRLEAKDSEAALRIGRNDHYRLIRALEILALTGKTPTELEAARPSDPDPRFTLWITDRPQPDLESRIATRTQAMLQDGLLEETKRLAAQYPKARALGAIGYAQVANFLAGKKPEGRKPAQGIEGLRTEIELATRQLVKSQRTFFRGLTAKGGGEFFVLEQDRSKLWSEMERLYA